jgi:hypothetical protein
MESEFGICVCEMNDGKLFRSKHNTYRFFIQGQLSKELTAYEAYFYAKIERMGPAMAAILKDNPNPEDKQ